LSSGSAGENEALLARVDGSLPIGIIFQEYRWCSL
jgi:hypothetical protein